MINNTDNVKGAIVIGGGFYGVVIATYLAKQRGLKNVLLVEKESALLMRASYHNQARIHNGYHYPRSFTTAHRSRVNLPKFIHDWPEAVKQDFTKLYAIARRNSKVTAKQFERFCREIGAKIKPADTSLSALFEPSLIEGVFLAEEYVFDAAKLACQAERELHENGVQIYFDSQVKSISRNTDNSLQITINNQDVVRKINSRYVFNCSYSGLNQFGGDFSGTKAKLKQEITEMALIKVPSVLQGIGVTVMDGPFFSMMPFPDRNLHTLSHVRYTPHTYWQDQKDIDPYQKLDNYECASRADRMIRDAGRYMPAILSAEYTESLFEVKTVLEKSEGDDSRPILFEKHLELPGCFSILGGKIDNIYDVLEKLEAEEFKCAME